MTVNKNLLKNEMAGIGLIFKTLCVSLGYQAFMNVSNAIARLAGLLAVLCLTGCASGPKFTPMAQVPDGKAVIYIYRKFNVGGVASVHLIYANGQPLVALENASYYPYVVPPGKITFGSKSETPDELINLVNSRSHLLTLDAVAGQTYYAEFHIGDTWGPRLILVSPDVGLKALQKCNLQ